jgi:hypothetical protein
MELRELNIQDFSTKIFNLWHEQWLLLTSGDYSKKDYHRIYFGEILAILQK